MDASWPLALLIGLAAGYLSGQFGIGGGIITTPALRLLLDQPELIAVGTPLPVIFPTAAAGALSYARRGLVDWRTGVTSGLVGGVFSALGALAATRVGGSAVLIVTAVLIVYMAVDMTLLALRTSRDTERAEDERVLPKRSWVWSVGLGVIAGLYSGFLGLGGGFVVVPALVRLFGFPIKKAAGTSLVTVMLLSVPGTITHYLLGNIDVGLALALSVGVIPGALLGAQVTARASERTVRVAFAAMLLVVGVILGVSESGIL